MQQSPFDMIIAISCTGIVFGTLSKVIITFINRPSRNPGAGVPQLQVIDDRLARIEQAVEAMSIEVERISEGQRFTTKLLSDRADTRLRVPPPGEVN
jgi:hypothetical protein